jgi:hypothetical protein
MSSSTGVFPDLDGLPQESNLMHDEIEGHRGGSTHQDLCVVAVFGERAEIVPCLRQRESIQPIAGQTCCEHQVKWDVQTTENDTWDLLVPPLACSH